MRLSKPKVNFARCAYAVISLWYLSLFPGRLGSDYSQLIALIRAGGSTDWWSSSFFWYFKVLSFDGQSIYLCSLVGLLALTHAVRQFTKTLPASEQVQNKVFFLISLFPLFPVFGLTVSHDVFQTAGLILLFAREVAIFRRIEVVALTSRGVAILVVIELMTTRTGIYVIILYILLAEKRPLRTEYKPSTQS